MTLVLNNFCAGPVGFAFHFFLKILYCTCPGHELLFMWVSEDSVRVLVWLKYSKISTLSKKITSSPIFNEGISSCASGSVEDTKCQNEHHDQNNL